MADFMFWRRLDGPGHDAALLTRTPTGWTLQGNAVFAAPEGPVSLSYRVDTDHGWHSVGGAVSGFAGDRPFDHVIRREADGWHLDGVLADGLAHLDDLDFGFTPATNILPLRRASVGLGERAELPAVWFNLDGAGLVVLRQIYERRSTNSFQYEAPDIGFETRIEFADNGFATRYPPFWETV